MITIYLIGCIVTFILCMFMNYLIYKGGNDIYVGEVVLTILLTLTSWLGLIFIILSFIEILLNSKQVAIKRPTSSR